MRSKVLSLVLLCSFSGLVAASGAQVFSDNFNRADSTTVGSNWTEVTAGGGSGDGSIQTNLLQIRNGGTAGRTHIFQNTTGTNWGSELKQPLNQTIGLVSWRFNMRANRANLSGFGAGNYGIALVLASSSTNFMAGNGYAAVWGQIGTDPLRLLRFTNGLSGTVTNLITASEGNFTNMTTDYYSVRVTYDPDTGIWELYARDDGASGFADPATGALSLVGSVTDTNFTGTPLNYMGPLWNYGTVLSQNAYFDNLTVEVLQFPPSIVIQPTNQLVIRGTDPTASLTAAGTRPLRYQWRFNGTNLAGKTNSTLTLTNFLEANEGNYDVVVTNNFGMMTSAVATLKISRDFGDAPSPYPTLLLNSGARHIVAPGVYLGALVDGETNGQPDVQAMGDDRQGTGDEDGVMFVSRVAAGLTATIHVTASTNGFLNAWMDFNQNGSWLDTGEQIFAGQALSAGVNTLNFSVPALAVAGTNAYCRFRFTSAGGLLALTGEAADGEVEDYQIAIDTPADVAVSASASPNPVAIGSNLTYVVTITNLGPSQASGVRLTNALPASVSFVSATLSQGAYSQSGGTVVCDFGGLLPGKKATGTIVVVPATEGQAAFSTVAAANESDPNSANNSASVSTSILPRPVVVTQPQSLTVTNDDTASFSVVASGTGTLLYQWRFNGTNVAGATGATLTVTNVQAVNAGSYDVAVNDSVGSVVSDLATLTVLVKPFITTQPQSQTANVGGSAQLNVVAGGTPTLGYQWYFNGTNALSGATSSILTLTDLQSSNTGGYTALVTNGVGVVTSTVAMLSVEPMDFGDAPASYPTLSASNGARHVIVPGVYLGSGVSQDADGKPDAAASADDEDDGVSFVESLVAGQTVTVEVVASTNGYLSAWIDWDQNGTWAEVYNEVFETEPVAAGTNTLNFEVPYFAQTGATFARFRFTTSTNAISSGGLAPDGEVEDHQITIAPATAVGLVLGAEPSEFAMAGVPFDQQPIIIVADDRGQPVYSDNSTTVTATRDSGAGTLQGDAVGTAVNGVVTFTNLYHTLANDITIRFTSGSFSAVTSTVVSVSHNVASKLAVQTQPSVTAIAGQTFPQQPAVEVTDAYGNAINEDSGTQVTASRNAGQGTLQGQLTITTTNGTALFTNLSHQVANPITLDFRASGLATATSGSIAITPTNVNRLGFVRQPSAAVAGTSFDVQPVLETQDVFGNPSPVGLAASLIVTQSLSAGTGLLQGTTNLNIGTAGGNGHLTNTDLRIDAAGSGKQLTARTAVLTNAVSSSFSVSPASFTKLQLLVPGETAAPGTTTGKTGTPSSQPPDTPFNVTVNAVDAFWNVVSTVTDTVKFSLSDTNAIPPANQAVVNGTKSVSVTLTTPGTQTITNTDVSDPGKTLSVSAPITVTSGQYTFATGGGAISADAAGGAYTNLTGPIYRELASADASGNGSGPWTIILNAPSGFSFDTGGTAPTVLITRTGGSGANSRNVNGVASGTSVAMTTVTSSALTFTVSSKSSGGVTCSLTWQNIRVRPSAGTPLARGNLTVSGTASLVGVPSGANFGPLREIPGAAKRLVVVTQPSPTATAGVVFSPQPTIGVADQYGNVRCSTNGTASPDNSSVITAGRRAGTGALQGTLTATASDAMATFANLYHTNANTITIGFTNSTFNTNVESANIVVGPAAADRLVFTAQPGSSVVGAPFGIQPVVISRDQYGNNSAVGFPTTLNVTMALSSGSGPLLGTTTTNIGTAGGNGTLAFTNLRIDSTGTDKQLTASAAGMLSTTSAVFAVGKGSQTITFPALADRVYGEVFSLSATASSGLPVSYEALSGPATNSGNVVTITGIGGVTIRATQSGDTNYNAATPVDRSFTANKASVAVGISSGPNPSLPGQEVTLTAAISAAPPGNGMPSGTAQFTTNGSALSAPVTLTNGAASVAATLTQHGSNSVTVSYSGDAFFNGNTNSLTPLQVVNTTPVAGADTLQRPPGLGVKAPVSTLLANDSDADADALTVSAVNSNSVAGGDVSLQNGWVCYTPPVGLTNDDSFLYSLADPFGGTAQGTVTVTVVSNAAPTLNLTIEDLGNGSFRLSFDGIPGEPYSIQYTTDLQHPDWQTLATQTADSLGRFEYVDTPPPGAGTRFYRSASP